MQAIRLDFFYFTPVSEAHWGLLNILLGTLKHSNKGHNNEG